MTNIRSSWVKRLKRLKATLTRINTQTTQLVPPEGSIRFGDLRRMTPFSRVFGYERGGPIDRYYIEQFLFENRLDIKGRVLEVKDNEYTRRFSDGRVDVSDVLDINPHNPHATVVADLTTGEGIAVNSYDCVILTQVLQLIYDFHSAIRTIHRILKPGGVLLLTVPGITHMDYRALGATWYWSFTEASITRILRDIFGSESVEVDIHGNVLTSAGFLYGLGATELRPEEYARKDPDYQLIISARAVKRSTEDTKDRL